MTARAIWAANAPAMRSRDTAGKTSGIRRVDIGKGATNASREKTVPDHIRESGSITPPDASRDSGATGPAAVIFEPKEDGRDMHTGRERGRNRSGQPTGYARYNLGKDEGNENQTR